jgi:hypothetical protein
MPMPPANICDTLTDSRILMCHAPLFPLLSCLPKVLTMHMHQNFRHAKYLMSRNDPSIHALMHPLTIPFCCYLPFWEYNMESSLLLALRSACSRCLLKDCSSIKSCVLVMLSMKQKVVYRFEKDENSAAHSPQSSLFPLLVRSRFQNGWRTESLKGLYPVGSVKGGS